MERRARYGIGAILLGVLLASTDANQTSAAIEKVQISGVLRVQWSDAEGGQGRDGFETRFARVAANFRLDEQLTGRISVEFAGGERAQNAELLDAYAVWRLNQHTVVLMGQQLMPLFYDLRMNLPANDALERVNVANAYFAGARGRGAYLDYQLGAGYRVQVGLWNSLTINDPQLTGRGGQASAMGSLNLRGERPRYQFNLGGLLGRRPGFQTRDAQNNPVNVPDTQRWLWYVENEFRDFPAPRLSLRLTYLHGRDRNPAGGVSAPQFLTPSDYNATVVYALYTPRPNHQLVARWEDFDPDDDRRSDRIRTLGLFYHYFPKQGVRLTAGYEWVDASNGRDRAYLAVQYQF